MDDLIREMLEPDRPAPGIVARRRRVVATTTIIALAAAGVTSLTTSALFTDQDTQGQSGFVTGTIDIAGNPENFTAAADNAAPGDYHYTSILVENTGTLQLRYAIESDTDGDAALAAALEVQLFSVANAGQCVSATVDGQPNSQNTALSAITGVRKLDTEAGLEPLLGSSQQGQQDLGLTGPPPGGPGSDRILPAGTSELLCIGLHLPLGEESDDLQDTSTDLTFTFYAEQVAHNP